jgi:hypothetical protein
LYEGPILYGVLKSRWRPPFGAFVALKINKNILEAKKVIALRNRKVHFYRKFLIE